MTKTKLKEIITISVLKELNDGSWSYDEAMKKWWVTMRNEQGLRLTDMGDLAFRMAQIEYYNYNFELDLDNSFHAFMLDLNKKIKCPYYIGVNKDKDKKQPFIRLYDSKIAMMVGLYGNISDYLKSVRIKK